MTKEIVWCLRHDSYMPNYIDGWCEAIEGELAGDREDCEPTPATLEL